MANRLTSLYRFAIFFNISRPTLIISPQTLTQLFANRKRICYNTIMRNRTFDCLLITVFLLSLIGWIGGWNRTMTAGNDAYLRGDYDAAQTAFQQAASDKPESPLAHYNLGTALYKQGHFKAASRAFQAALSTQTDDLSFATIYYNLGNAQFMAGDFTAAIESYQHTLQLDPQDTDAQHNLALARQRLQQQQSLAQQQQQNKNAPPETEPDEQSKAAARRLLERFSENENRLRQKLLQEQRKSGYRREKDW